ncbi:FAD-dependent oxidoreductase [Chloracidobacterium validum]|uniref:FAD-dependent oxidoreductase n=1 Tax=Chloracidobacterium validum TaxID=2821543 RepID=A0ABX8B7R7_9BACT|nr:FAD-dependent oxidoreductase [Chloracidobacterium validum]QUW02992.1 FAD-dependent oxidoreductase [Chloracidobacterium validum]
MGKHRVLILGGGFGGLYTARALCRSAAAPAVEVTLVSRTPNFLFLPLLYEILTDEVTDWQIAPPLTEVLPSNCRFIHGDVVGGEFSAGQCRVRVHQSDSDLLLEADTLVLALGNVSDDFGLPGVKTHTRPFRSLADAHALKSAVEEAVRRATGSRETAAFAIIGAGPSGVELAAVVADKLHAELRKVGLPPTQVHLHLVDRLSEILPQYASALRHFAERELARRGVHLHLGVGVAACSASGVELENGAHVAADTIVWTAGSRPTPVLAEFPFVRDRRGRIPVARTLEVPGFPGVYALGDIAASAAAPATAQVAVRQALVVADNIAARLRGAPLREYHYESLGEMMTLGRGTGAANILGLAFDGVTGYLTRRLVYLLAMPDTWHATRVGLSWLGQSIEEVWQAWSVPAATD